MTDFRLVCISQCGMDSVLVFFNDIHVVYSRYNFDYFIFCRFRFIYILPM